jgi:hypothetical protein
MRAESIAQEIDKLQMFHYATDALSSSKVNEAVVSGAVGLLRDVMAVGSLLF